MKLGPFLLTVCSDFLNFENLTSPNKSPCGEGGIMICISQCDIHVSCGMCVCVCWQCLLLHLPGSSKEGKSWKDAQSICSSFEGSLVAIEDEIEQGGGKVNCTTI